MPPGKKAQRKKAPEKIGPRKITASKIAPPLQNIASRKNAHRKIAPRKIVLYFCCFWHYLTVAPLKTFYSN